VTPPPESSTLPSTTIKVTQYLSWDGHEVAYLPVLYLCGLERSETDPPQVVMGVYVHQPPIYTPSEQNDNVLLAPEVLSLSPCVLKALLPGLINSDLKLVPALHSRTSHLGRATQSCTTHIFQVITYILRSKPTSSTSIRGAL
jgi:hypothetical protein